MSKKEAPNYIRVHGQLYRRANPQALHAKVQRMVGQLTRILEVAADDADTLKRVLGNISPGDVGSYDRAAHYLVGLAAPMGAADESFRRVVRAMVRANMIDATTAASYFPWVKRMQPSEPSPEEEEEEEEEEGRTPIEGGGVTDYEAPSDGGSVDDTLYPYPLKSLHWSSVPAAIKVKGHVYRRMEG